MAEVSCTVIRPSAPDMSMISIPLMPGIRPSLSSRSVPQTRSVSMPAPPLNVSLLLSLAKLPLTSKTSSAAVPTKLSAWSVNSKSGTTLRAWASVVRVSPE